MAKNTQALVLSSIIASLGWVILMSTGLYPIFAYTTPAIAGYILIVVAFECGTKWAYLSFAAVSLLSLITITNAESVLMFILLFGYYPILRLRLQVMSPKPLVIAIKLALFSASIILTYLIVAFVTGLSFKSLPYDPSVYVGIFLFILGVTWIYDRAINNMTRLYVIVIRPRLKLRLRK